MANSPPVFLNTSLDTHLCMVVSSDETVASFKRKIMAEHLVSFPEIGEIIVKAVKTYRKGIMYHLSESMPMHAVLDEIEGTTLLYIDAVTTKHEKTLRNRRNGEEFKLPIETTVEDLVVSEVRNVGKEVLVDPLHDLFEGPSRVVKKTEKKKRKKDASSEDTSLRLTESRKEKDERFERNSFKEERDNSEKRRRRKKAKVSEPSNDASVLVGEPHNMKEVAHEVSLEKERDISRKNLGQDSESPQIPDNANLMEPNISNPVDHIPTEELTSSTIHPYPNEEAGETEQNAQAKGDVDFHDQPDANQIIDQGNTNQGTEESSDPTKAPIQSTSTSGIPEFVEVKAKKDDTKKKKHRKTKGFSSDAPSEVPPTRENEPQVEDSIQVSEKEKDSKMPEKTGCTSETRNSIPSEFYKSTEEPDYQPENDQIATSDGMEECRKENDSKNVLKESDHVMGGDTGLVSRGKKKHKKTKDAFTEVPSQEPSSIENESCKEASNSVLEKKANEAGDADFINNADNANLMAPNLENPTELMLTQNLISAMSTPKLNKKAFETEPISQPKVAIEFHNQPDSEQTLNHGYANQGAGESAVKEKLRKKRKKTKGLSSEMPYEVAPIREDESEKADAKVLESNQVVEKERDSEMPQKSAVGGTTKTNDSIPCQLDKEKDIRFHNQLGVEQAAISDKSKEESRKDMEISQETVSVEKRGRKKKKAASIEGLAQEVREKESGQERENDLILERERSKKSEDTGGDPGVVSVEKKRRKKAKELSTEENVSCKERECNLNLEKGISKEAGDANLINNAGGDPEVISKEKRKRKKTKEPSAIENESSKERGSNLIVDKEASKEAGDASLTNNGGDVAFPAADQEEVANKIVSDILADLKEGNPIPPDGQTNEDVAPKLQLLVNAAADQQKVETKEKRKSKKESSNKIETSHDTMNEKKRNKGAVRENEIGSRATFVLASSQEDSVGDGKKTKKRKEEAIISGTIKDSVPQTDSSGKKEPRTKIKKSLKEDNLPSSKGESKEKGYTDTLNAPNTQEKEQHSGDNFVAEKNQNKETSTEGVQTYATENINFIDYFLPKETREKNKIRSNSFSKDGTSASLDTTVSEKTKKSLGKNETSEKPVKISKEHNLSGTSNNDVPKRDDDNMKRLVADMAVASDASTEDNEESKSQLRRRMVAVRKVAASKSIFTDKMDASRRKNSAVVPSGALFDDASNNEADENESVNRGSPMPGKDKGREMMSPGSGWKDERIANDDVPMSQESAEPRKKVNLSSILRSSASYKKAKITVSQSQAEDSEMIDVVFETQPN